MVYFAHEKRTLAVSDSEWQAVARRMARNALKCMSEFGWQGEPEVRMLDSGTHVAVPEPQREWSQNQVAATVLQQWGWSTSEHLVTSVSRTHVDGRAVHIITAWVRVRRDEVE